MSIKKRANYFSWDEAFMHICKIIAERSKDPSTQTGACIVNKKNIILGLGYNGFPRGCSDDALPWDREGEFGETKYPFVVHAEANAVLNATASLEDTKLYCTLFPCNECAKIIIQKGITEIIYADDKYHDKKEWQASRKMLDLAGIKYRKYETVNALDFKMK